jgi:hypothetical protein
MLHTLWSLCTHRVATWLPAVLLAAAGTLSTAFAQTERWTYRRAADAFDRAYATTLDGVDKVKIGRTLSGSPGDWGIAGAFEYDFSTPKTGWYRIHTIGLGAGVEYFLHPAERQTAGGAYFFGTSGVLNGKDALTNQPLDKVGNVWIEAGKYTLRLQRYWWTGFPAIRGFVVTESSPVLADSVRPFLPEPAAVYPWASCPPLKVEAGGLSTPQTLTVRFDDLDGKTLTSQTIHVAASAHPMEYHVPLYCDKQGVFKIHYGDGGRAIDWRELPQLSYEVIDHRPAVRTAPLELTLLHAIDCVASEPDYSVGGTVVSKSLAGTYRESGSTGFTRWQRTSAAARPSLAKPTWFAYTLPITDAQAPYLLQIDYPDDALRTFTITVRENLTRKSQPTYMYPVSVGIDSGGEFRRSQKIQTASLLFWARSPLPRLVFQTAHDGRRAACARIRIYRADSDLPAASLETDGREVVSWYEEGLNFLSFYGVQEHWRPGALLEATGRAVSALSHAGYTTFIPTAAIYEFSLYPSRFNSRYSQLDQDILRRLLLFGEKYGIGLIAELHPRSDELAWPGSATSTDPALLHSKDGTTNFFQPDGKTRNLPPLYNPLHPAVQARYIAMVGELADRYKESPMFRGVSIRLMQHSNPGITNFHSLEWGYDLAAVQQFAADTGVTVPGPLLDASTPDDRDDAQARYDWLMANAKKKWIRWRCEQITKFFARIVARVRSTRPDYRVYLNVFARGATDTLSGGGADSAEGWRGAGIDPSLLGEIAGLWIINSTHAFGRREADVARTQPLRDELLDPKRLNAFLSPGRSANFMTGANYLEQTEAVLPPQDLGFDAASKHGWTTTPAHPPGRHSLERFAVQLAETDATMLGEGGNGYALGQRPMRDWFAEYRRLPALPFKTVGGATDPVAVRSLVAPAGQPTTWFYAVNRERYPVTVQLHLSGAVRVLRPSTGEIINLDRQTMKVTLDAYELRVYTAPANSEIDLVTATVPQADLAQVRQLTKDLARLTQNPRIPVLSQAERERLSQDAALAQTELNAGHLWRARTLPESWPLQSIYRHLETTLPGLRDE